MRACRGPAFWLPICKSHSRQAIVVRASNPVSRSRGKEKHMHVRTSSWFAVCVLGAGAVFASALPAPSASANDQAFVAKVSQGGLYEVEAGKVAAMRATAPVVKNFGILESHDHEGVGSNLKRVAAETGVTIPPGLNAEFTDRLNKLKSVPKEQFDAYYMSDMKQIHNKDEGLFLKEAQEGTAPYQSFARPTAVLVKAHLGWLNTL
jgi:putative membrane protein